MHIPALAVLGNAIVSLDPGGCISWIVAGLVAGWLAGLLVRGRGFGCLGDIVLGLVGALVGVVVIGLLPLSVTAQLNVGGQYHFIGTLIVAFFGALILALLGRLIGGPSRSRRYYDWHR